MVGDSSFEAKIKSMALNKKKVSTLTHGYNEILRNLRPHLCVTFSCFIKSYHRLICLFFRCFSLPLNFELTTIFTPK